MTETKEKTSGSKAPEAHKSVTSPPKSVTSSSSAPNKDDLETDPRFKFGPPLIQTPQDAEYAFLRGQLDEKELRAALAKFGTLPGDLAARVQVPTERPDEPFHRAIPEDLMTPTLPPEESLEVHLKQVNEKQAMREEASKEAENDKTREETVARESNPEFGQKLAAKHITDPLEKQRGKDGSLTAGSKSKK